MILSSAYMQTHHQRIIFSGNGYSEEWVKEAERRGLPNLKSMVSMSCRGNPVTEKADPAL